MRRRRAVLLAALFLATLLGAAALLRMVLPRYSLGIISPKLARLTEQPGRYDCLVVGTSRIHHGFVPERFDQVLGERGHESRSFNLGVRNLRQPELLSLLRRLPAEGVQGLKWVLVEWDTVASVRDAHRGQARSVWWHDPRNTLWSLRREWKEPGIAQTSLEGVRNHAEAGTAWLLNVGRLAPTVQRVGRPSVYGAGQLGQRLDGYVRIDQADGAARAARDFDPDSGLFQDMVETLRDPFRTAAAADQRRMQAWIVEAAEALGARVVFFVGPQIRSVERPDPDLATVFYYDDPERLPGFYDRTYRFDPAHWNHEGSLRFSDLLARDFADLVDAEEGG